MRFQTSVLKSGARTISWIIPPWRKPRPFDQSWLTRWTGSSFPSLSPPSEPRPTPITSRELCWLGSSCRYIETKCQYYWICLQQFNWNQVYSVCPTCRLLEMWTDQETTSFWHTSTWPRCTRSPATGLSHTSWGCQSGLFSTSTPCLRTTAWGRSLKFPLKCKSVPFSAHQIYFSHV